MYKNIFITQANNRFTNAILSNKLPHKFIHSIIQNNIYDIFYQFNIDLFIFNASSIDSSVVQFIQEFSESKNIFFYIDTIEQNKLDIINNTQNIETIIPESLNINLNQKSIIYHNNVINTSIFYKQDIPKQTDVVTCFLDNIIDIPDELNEHLYPKSNKKIRLYNNANINHYQNLGLVEEQYKNTILNESEYFISINNHYVFEAIQAGCKILGPNLHHYAPPDREIITIENFLEKNIL